MESVTLSLQITVIGMGLVFMSLIILWGMMELLVRLTHEEQSHPETLLADKGNEYIYKQHAAAIAVAMGMAELEGGAHEFPLPPTVPVSPWQTVMRTDMLKKRGQVR